MLDEGFELDKITGVFIGEWNDERLYAVLYTDTGKEYLARCEGGFEGWKLVSWKDSEGKETVLSEPVDSPSPLTVATSLIMEMLLDGDEIVI